MHEMALAEGVLMTALDQARTQDRAVRRVQVWIGQLQQIDLEVFRGCLDAVRDEDEPLLRGMEIDLKNEIVAFTCRACERTYGLDDMEKPPGEDELEAIHFVPELAHSYIRCPDCQSPDFEVTRGRGVWIETIELVDE
jgi:hydrogenase nickel incorporation protein HypA/HybF